MPEDNRKLQLVTPAMQVDRGMQLVPQNLAEAIEMAKLMARAGIAVPQYMHDNPGACVAVAMQAWRWGMDPFAVAQMTYRTKNNRTGEERIGYQAQLIAAVINTRAGLIQRPEIYYEGDAEKRRCKVVGQFIDGAVQEYTSPMIAQIEPKFSPLWQTDPDRQLGYYSLRAFARLFAPEVILGVYDREELESRTPIETAPRIGRELAVTAEENDGFVSSDIDGETRMLSDSAFRSVSAEELDEQSARSEEEEWAEVDATLNQIDEPRREESEALDPDPDDPDIPKFLRRDPNEKGQV